MARTILACSAALLIAGCAAAPTATTHIAAEPAAAVPPAIALGPDFVARNGAAPGVVTTASGLEYFIVKSGPPTGAWPTASDSVTFDYEGKLLNGETFDSSFERGEPLTGRVTGFVPGFSEALQLMRPGDEWIVWIPPELGYGSKEVGPIPANSVLRFRLALHSVAPTS
jgi:FKBP-type peptidyl-prolyl cis-trans isomerase